MSRAVFFWVATLLLMLAAPRAAGAGVEVSGLGGLFVIGGEVESVSGSGTLRAHVMAGPAASYGIDLGYGGLEGESSGPRLFPTVLPGPTPIAWSDSRDQQLAWLTASLKVRAARADGPRLYAVMLAGVSDHITRGPGPLPLETAHHGRFILGFGAGLESANVPGPLFEVRTFATGLDEGAAMGFAMNVGIRLAP